MCNCFEKIGDIEALSTKRYRVWIGEIVQVVGGSERVLGIGLQTNDEKGKMTVTKFSYCPSCGARWET